MHKIFVNSPKLVFVAFIVGLVFGPASNATFVILIGAVASGMGFSAKHLAFTGYADDISRINKASVSRLEFDSAPAPAKLSLTLMCLSVATITFCLGSLITKFISIG